MTPKLDQIAPRDLEDLATGSVFLATGGGGDPYVSVLAARAALEEHGPVDLLAPEALDDDAFVVTIGSVGAPSAGLELLPSLDDPRQALEAYEIHVGRKVDALVSFEIGGGNSLIPLVAAAGMGLPVIDGDGMGRALPEAQMITFAIAGVSPTPALVRDYAGNSAVLDTQTPATYERHVRAMSAAMGGMVTAVEHPMTGRELKASIVPKTISFRRGAWPHDSGETGVRPTHAMDPLRSIFASSIYGDFFPLYSGKVVDTSTAIVGGYDVGRVTIEPFAAGAEPMVIDVKNEFLDRSDRPANPCDGARSDHPDR